MSTLRNRVQLIGHVGIDPEMKTLESGAKYATIKIATNESYKTQSGEWKEETYWHFVVGWNKMAERMMQLAKGSFVMIEGKLVNRSYNDAAGVKKYITEVRAVSMLKLDKKSPDSPDTLPEMHEIVEEEGLPF